MPSNCAENRDFGDFRKALLPNGLAPRPGKNVDKITDGGKHEQKKAVEQSAPTKRPAADTTDDSGKGEREGKRRGKEDFMPPAQQGKKAKNEENLRKFEKNERVTVDKK
ncbi:hypothetical protein [uncultured Mailhella sp.]|uniref:hypothetical protein n=1 Tax=uncultured Mailhella sp. TaxID=1981031 RepID=UPI0025F9986B|nr:hypothetical protein [uncultured Mailhella sp.]